MKSKITKLIRTVKNIFSNEKSIRIFAACCLIICASGLIAYQLFLNKGKKFVVAPVTCKAVVIGSGVGGLTSSIYLSQLGIDTILITGKEQGGALATTGWVENWPGEEKILGSELVDKLSVHAQNCATQMISGEITKVDFKKFPYTLAVQAGNKESTITTYSVIIATGATPKKLSIPGEAEFWGRGVTTCAICDGPLHKGKDVVVIGGGDSAMTEAQILAPLARKVYVLIRNESRAKSNLLQSVSSLSNVKILYHTKPLEIYGDQLGVQSIRIDNKGQTQNLAVSGVFLAIGSTPNSSIFAKALKLTKDGLIKTDNHCRTSSKGVFAIGDVTNSEHRQAIVAAGQGCVAALESIQFLNQHELNKPQEEPKKQKKTQTWVKSEPKNSNPKSANNTENLEKSEKQNSTNSGVINVSSIEELDQVIENSQLPMIVDFYATWCPPCKAMSPIIDAMAVELEQKAIVVKVNIDKAPGAAPKYQVQGVPTFIIFKEGKEMERFVGYTPGETLTRALIE